MSAITETRQPRTRDAHGSPAVVVTGEGGMLNGYVLTPIGWRVRHSSRRDAGDLVIDPALSALLDAAAAGA